MTTIEKHKRRFPHIGFSLLVTSFLLISAGALRVWLPYHREQLAIDAIERVTGYSIERSTDGPQWLRYWIGDRYMKVFDRVSIADLSDSEIDDAFLEHLVELNLSSLDLSSTHVTDAGLARLAGQNELEFLELNHTRITDEGLAHIGKFNWLIMLELDDTQITDDGLANLSALHKLSDLSLRNTRVTDAGLAHLVAIPNLDTLWLDNTPITDKGLVHLAGLSKLESVTLEDTNVTKEGVAILQKKLPKCDISFSSLGVEEENSWSLPANAKRPERVPSTPLLSH